MPFFHHPHITRITALAADRTLRSNSAALCHTVIPLTSHHLSGAPRSAPAST